jgi:hypothetical protein
MIRPLSNMQKHATSPPILHRRTDPVFVVGHGRSGTSILSDLLRKYLRLAFGTESQFFIRYHRQLQRYGDLTQDANRRLLLTDLSRERFFERSLKYGIRLDVDRAVRESEPTYAGVLSAVMWQSAACQGMTRWGDKTPEYTLHLPVLRALFPAAQFIHIVRDGRDVALSGFLMHFGAKNVYVAAREWSHVLAQVHAFAETMPETSFIELRYEDLLSQTEITFARIMRFLEIEDPDGQVSAAVGQLARAELRTGNSYKWKSELSRGEQERFAAVAGSWLRRYGYEVPASELPAPGRLAAMCWNVDNVARRMLMREYWQDTFYKARLRLRARALPLRSWRFL